VLAVGATIAAPVAVEAAPPATAEDRAASAWKALCAALEEMMPTDGRLLIVGSHRENHKPGFTVENIQTRMEQVHPKVCMPVERSVQFVRFDNGKWRRLEEVC
jgi:hypothetical protein